jgi:hypothetical protein
MPVITPPHSTLLWRLTLLMLSIVLSCSVGSAGASQDRRQQALDGFQKRMFDYLAIRAEATRHLPVLRGRESIIEIYRTRALHVQAVRDAREDAQTGDVFGPLAAPIIRSAIAATLRQHDITVDHLLTEQRVNAPRGGHRPLINDDFPWIRDAALPPALIAALPAPPRPLQYRFLDRDLILVDVHLGLVIDILPDALPGT